MSRGKILPHTSNTTSGLSAACGSRPYTFRNGAISIRRRHSEEMVFNMNMSAKALIHRFVGETCGRCATMCHIFFRIHIKWYMYSIRTTFFGQTLFCTGTSEGRYILFVYCNFSVLLVWNTRMYDTKRLQQFVHIK